jgi:hypothetical protein
MDFLVTSSWPKRCGPHCPKRKREPRKPISDSNEKIDGEESDLEKAKDMRVLIALDATPRCAEIAREAACRPWPADSTFSLLHVLDPFPFANAPVSLKRAKDDALAQVGTASQSLVEAGWKVAADVVLEHSSLQESRIGEETSAAAGVFSRGRNRWP